MIEINKHQEPRNAAPRDELALLEAERDRLLSMIAYHHPPKPTWLIGLSVIVVVGIAALVVANVDTFSGRIFAVVLLAVSAYILTRRIVVFGIPARVFTIATLSGSQTAGEPEARSRLAECEAKILDARKGGA